jgi:hypothetical protein
MNLEETGCDYSTGSGLCPVMGFVVSGVESLGFHINIYMLMF